MYRSLGILYVLIGAASFGFTPIFVKTGFEQGYSLGQLNIIQMIIASCLLWSIFLFKKSTATGLHKHSILKLMITGTFVGLTSIFYYGAIQYLPASLAIILLFQFVWIGMLYDWLINKVRPSKINVAALCVTLTGVFLASNILNGSLEKLPVMGFVLGILSGFSYAGFIFFSGQVATNVHPLLRSPLMVTGSLVLVFIVFFKDISGIPYSDGQLWKVGLGVALFGAILPPLFFALGAHRIPGALANVLSSIELPVAIISASLILSESVNLTQWLGISLIIIAIMINEGGSYFIQKGMPK